MNDTSLKIDKLLHEKIMQRTGEERLIMSSSMFDVSKEIVISSIKEQNPNISKSELNTKLFIRLYSADFENKIIKKITDYLKNIS